MRHIILLDTDEFHWFQLISKANLACFTFRIPQQSVDDKMLKTLEFFLFFFFFFFLLFRIVIICFEILVGIPINAVLNLGYITFSYSIQLSMGFIPPIKVKMLAFLHL